MSGRRDLFEPQIKIRYRKLPLSGSIFWPIIDIQLPVLPQPILALVDSGASNSILHEDIAEVLNIKRKKSNRIYRGISASGEFRFWRPKPIRVSIYNHNFPFNFTVPIDNRSLIWPCILGHNTLFRIAKLEFRTFNNYFKLFFRADIN